MHSVIKNLLVRKNKRVPVKDGRRIALVLFGGVMISVRGMGALAVLENAGLSSAFDGIYTMSSGFPNASYFLAGQSELGASVYYEELINRKALNFFRFWRIIDSPYIVQTVKQKKPLDFNQLIQNTTKLFLMLINTKTGKAEFLEVHQYLDEYFKLLEAAVSLPYLVHSSVKIGGNFYHDILKNHNLDDMLKKALDSDATDILVLYNYPWQQKLIKKRVGDFTNSDRVREICLGGGNKLDRFQTKSEMLKEWFTDAKRVMEQELK